MTEEDEIGNTIVTNKKIKVYKNKLSIFIGLITNILSPNEYEIISFDVNKDYIFLVLNSNQGYKDRELLLPMLTTHIFIMPLPQ